MVIRNRAFSTRNTGFTQKSGTKLGYISLDFQKGLPSAVGTGYTNVR